MDVRGFCGGVLLGCRPDCRSCGFGCSTQDRRGFAHDHSDSTRMPAIKVMGDADIDELPMPVPVFAPLQNH